MRERIRWQVADQTGKLVLVVTGEFPAMSETFVLDQICGLIDRGFDVRILALRPAHTAPTPPELLTYQLDRRIHYVTPLEPRGGDRETGPFLIDLIKNKRLSLAAEFFRNVLREKVAHMSFPDKFQMASYAISMTNLPEPDFVLCHFGVFGDLMVRVRAALKKKWPIATIFHGYDLSQLVDTNGKGLYRRLMASGDIFFPVSEHFLKKLKELGAPKNKIELLRMGIKRDLPARSQKPDDPTRPFTFVSVGRLVEKKGHQFTLKALAECIKAGANMKVIICGDGPLSGGLHSIANALELHNHVEFRGVQPREAIIQLLCEEADAFILPSVTAGTGDTEGVPVALEEAMAVGLPVISSYHSGIPEVVEADVSGILAPEKDIDALVRAMMSLASDEARAKAMGLKGQERVIRDLGLDLWLDHLAAMIEARIASTPTR